MYRKPVTGSQHESRTDEWDVGRTRVTLENLLASSLERVLGPEVSHEDEGEANNEQLRGDGGPESGSVALGGVLRTERDRGDDTADTTSSNPASRQSRPRG